MNDNDSTKEKILSAAREMFIENGYHKTSMSAIADRADLGKGTLYWHFDSKSELFQEMIRKEGRKILGKLSKLCQENNSVEEIVRKFIYHRLKRMIKYKKTTEMFMDGENFVNKDFKREMFNIHFQIIDKLESVIIRGKKEGVFKTDYPRRAAGAIVGTINGTGSLLFSNKEPEIKDVEDNVDFIYNHIMFGLKKKEVDH